MQQTATRACWIATAIVSCTQAPPLTLRQPVGHTHSTRSAPGIAAPAPVTSGQGPMASMPARVPERAAPQVAAAVCDLPDTAAEAPLFASNDTSLRARGAQILDDLVACSMAGLLGGRDLLVVGYADPRGGVRYNEELALERARAVRRYLIRRGIAPERITIDSRGERRALGEAPESWMLDRRVEISLLSGGRSGR